ncbi:unnamed protein product [Paramecium primaurelia]|uniref:Peptidase A1 domain-containing protein n=1 Tax=Paramecium primaurelia TaxID=5886 RepID=A0A8S1PXZ7_PARPR|nr:unnamed protein product [Paramecium primaurelia]
MQIKVLLFAIIFSYVLSRRIKQKKSTLIHISLIQKGQRVQEIIKSTLDSDIKISFELSREVKEQINNQNLLIDHLDRLQYAYQIVYIPLRNQYNAQYFGKIQLGQQEQTFELLFDTGSSYTWVASNDCNTCQKAGVKNFFNCETSQSCSYLNKKIKLQYGKGKAVAQFMVENLKIGQLLIQNQTMLLLDELTELKKFEGDGLAGLGFDTLSDGYPTIIDNLFIQNLIDKKEFSIYLTEHQNSEDKQSKLIIGGKLDNLGDYNNDQWHYCDVINKNYWAILGDYVSFVSKDGKIRRSLKSIKPVHYVQDDKSDILFTSLFVIDSGTSLIVLYKKDHERLIEYLKDFGIECFDSEQYQGISECDQSNIDDYPNFEISLCGKQFIIPPEKYLLCSFFQCYLMIAPFDQRVSILGDLFIREYYTHFIQETPRKIGFIKATQD